MLASACDAWKQKLKVNLCMYVWDMGIGLCEVLFMPPTRFKTNPANSCFDSTQTSAYSCFHSKKILRINACFHSGHSGAEASMQTSVCARISHDAVVLRLRPLRHKNTFAFVHLVLHCHILHRPLVHALNIIFRRTIHATTVRKTNINSQLFCRYRGYQQKMQ